jgi:hypothetical protein
VSNYRFGGPGDWDDRAVGKKKSGCLMVIGMGSVLKECCASADWANYQ